MMRVFVVLLAVFMVVAAIGPAVAGESKLSPFYGLVFNDPDDSIASDVRINPNMVNMSMPGSHYLTWRIEKKQSLYIDSFIGGISMETLRDN